MKLVASLVALVCVASVAFCQEEAAANAPAAAQPDPFEEGKSMFQKFASMGRKKRDADKPSEESSEESKPENPADKFKSMMGRKKRDADESSDKSSEESEPEAEKSSEDTANEESEDEESSEEVTTGETVKEDKSESKAHKVTSLFGRKKRDAPEAAPQNNPADMFKDAIEKGKGIFEKFAGGR